MVDGIIDLTIVTPERSIVHELVEEVQIPGREGYLGILPGHAPLFTELGIGELGYKQGDQWTYIALASGFAEVLPNQVRVLAEIAEKANEIDAERARRTKEEAEQKIVRGGNDVNYDAELQTVQRATTWLQVSAKADQS